MSLIHKKPAILALENGKVFRGYHFGAAGESVGEVVFNTGMTGYQEVITDPSYQGQIVTMTYPLIGNYGVNEDDIESARPHVAGFIVKEYCSYPSNFRMTGSLSDYLARYGIIGLEGIDTRELVRTIREKGAMRGVLSTVDFDGKSLVAKAKASQRMEGADLVKEVTCTEPYYVIADGESWNAREEVRHIKEFHSGLKRIGRDEFDKVQLPTVVAFDYGIKLNILRKLAARGVKVAVLPATSSAEEALAHNPAGIFLSNGPGDPDAVTYAIETVRELLGKKPMFGICLGHQILGLALGGATFKLKFGHRGENQPVMDASTGKVEISSQNHGFALSPGSIPDLEGTFITHTNLNDNTVEGLVADRYRAFSVQYHPESSPGPHDSDYLFDRFLDMVREETASAV